jgi:predicted phosphodiesterase
MRLGIMSDAHGNIGGFEAALRLLLAGKADRCIFLGDAVGYIPDLSVVRALITHGFPWVAGNHEVMLLDGTDRGELDEIYRLAETRRQLSPAEAAFIRALPKSLELEWDGTRCLFVHGSPRDPISGYVYPDADLADCGGTGFDAVFMGHTHRPFLREHDGAIYVNVGSCGLPRDASGRGSACLFDTATRQASLLSFSLAEASRAALEAFALAPATRRLLERSIDQG